MVGEELRARGVTVVAGADGVPEARDAAHRDRPGLYAHYLVGERLDVDEVRQLVRDEGLTALVAAGAVGEGHVPVDALAQLWDAFPPGSFLALTLAGGDAGQDATDVEAMLAATEGSEHPSRIVVRRTFRHRLSHGRRRAALPRAGGRQGVVAQAPPRTSVSRGRCAGGVTAGRLGWGPGREPVCGPRRERRGRAPPTSPTRSLTRSSASSSDRTPPPA